ncbi:hypothetical protein TTHERM_000753491 (macronuclear) [Tetrahymena thermophila SB210]|uniref:Uncharacterized protein n=1 Tax=Tetrahymena thermophila (strain SB210) TaxID=312017 RepID=W7X902_TETTS|nr:hypothetical protein TTHERM_000753491 [Tetrahymena thermophila SB210]EWS73822.1 hypothetical protein TTHERM_000753491 [Tetrahymena thermophila SB210]|eukprot:XP_012653645.1 hypothetical protein TTHERM_000753491 [Tetrahymena thermophila SB210]
MKIQHQQQIFVQHFNKRQMILFKQNGQVIENLSIPVRKNQNFYFNTVRIKQHINIFQILTQQYYQFFKRIIKQLVVAVRIELTQIQSQRFQLACLNLSAKLPD